MRSILAIVMLSGCADVVPAEPDPVVEQAPIAQTDQCGQWFSGDYVVNMRHIQMLRERGYELKQCPR
jgi:hypothetical protein